LFIWHKYKCWHICAVVAGKHFHFLMSRNFFWQFAVRVSGVEVWSYVAEAEVRGYLSDSRDTRRWRRTRKCLPSMVVQSFFSMTRHGTWIFHPGGGKRSSSSGWQIKRSPPSKRQKRSPNEGSAISVTASTARRTCGPSILLIPSSECCRLVKLTTHVQFEFS